MACILTLTGSVIGLSLALVLFFVFQTPVLTALAIWSLAGMAVLALGLAVKVANGTHLRHA